MFSLEDSLRIGASHLESLVDAQGRTYFNVFRTTPAEAVTDWPDFVDPPSRYFEAAAMVEPIIGRGVHTAGVLRRRLFSHIQADGLAYRPDTPISHSEAVLFDQSRLLYALTTWAMHDPADGEIRARLSGLVGGLQRRATLVDGYAHFGKIDACWWGTLIRPLLQAGLLLAEASYVDFARALARGILDHSDLYGTGGLFCGHTHSHLGTAAGILACGIISGEGRFVQRVREILEYARSISTEFGFVPEVAQREDDLVSCETCAIMDYLDVALLLARHVDAGYWELVERVARNHLVESQVAQRQWLNFAPALPDEDGIIRSDLERRLAGAFAGWSAPHGLLAYEETFWPEWVKTPRMYPRYLGKVRALQNCCAGAGIRALHQVWSNIAWFDGDCLQVNLVMDKRINGARITSLLPLEGKVVIQLERKCDVRVRAPAVTGNQPLEVALHSAGRAVRVEPVQRGPFLEVGNLAAGDRIEITFPQPTREEIIAIGNPDRQQYRFRVAWKGNTVTEVQPAPDNARSGYSRVEKRDVRLFYGEDTPGRLYQRRADLVLHSI